MSPRQPAELPRGLIFLGSIWLIASWLLSIGIRTPIQPVSASYTPGVRTMLLCVTVGLMIGWPLLRLSQPARSAPVKQTLLDLVSLIALIQVVVWPLRLVTPWSLDRTAAMDATLTLWVILAGAAVASGSGIERPGPRSLAMGACMAMCLLGPAMAWLGLVIGVDLTSLLPLSPVYAIHHLTGGGGAPPTGDDWAQIAGVGLAGAASWGLLLLALAREERSLPAIGTAPPIQNGTSD